MQTDAPSATGVLETLGRLEAEVKDALAGTRGYLKGHFKSAVSEDTSTVGGWSQFLNETDKPPSATGTSHGVLSLLACSEPSGSEIIAAAARFIAERRSKDGGWTKPSLENKCSLSRITSLALRALLDSGSHQSLVAVRDGIDWLLDAQNDDGGWGNAANDGESDVTSTSFALQALSRVVGLTQRGRDGLRRGRAWLIEARNVDHSWGHTRGTRGSVAHTSEAVDGLLACGQNPGSLLATEDWLGQHIKDAAQFNERYLISDGPCAGTSVTWTQCSKDRGLIALLSLGSNLIAPPVIHAVSGILSRQVQGTYWTADAIPDAEPIWAVKEAVVALRLFQDRIERDRASMILVAEIGSLRKDLAATQAQMNQLLNRQARQSWQLVLRSLLNAIRKPSVAVSFVTVLLTVAYVALRNTLRLPQYAEILVAICAFVALALPAYQLLRDARRGSDK